MRHRIFVGGSSEELPIARALRDNLVQCGHDVRLWNQGIFAIGKTAFESLLAALDEVDSAVFVFAPNDLVTIRGERFDAVRDNVVFELGLFTGRLGRDRTFWVAPRDQLALRIASDLLGVLPAEYIEPHDGDWVSALSEACRRIDDALYTSARARGARSTPLAADVMRDCIAHVNRAMQHITATVAARASTDNACVETLPDTAGFIVRCGTRSDLTVRFGRIEDCTCDEPGTVIALPANEFFDDECVSDVRSALGSFVAPPLRRPVGGLQAPGRQRTPAVQPDPGRARGAPLHRELWRGHLALARRTTRLATLADPVGGHPQARRRGAEV